MTNTIEMKQKELRELERQFASLSSALEDELSKGRDANSNHVQTLKSRYNEVLSKIIRLQDELTHRKKLADLLETRIEKKNHENIGLQ